MTMTDDEIAAELRSLLEDLGDAATIAAGATHLTSTPHPRSSGRRPVSLIAVGVAAAGLLAVVAAVVVRDGRPDAQGSPAPDTTPTSSTGANTAMEEWVGPIFWPMRGF